MLVVGEPACIGNRGCLGNLCLPLSFAVKSKTPLNNSLFLKSRQVHEAPVPAWAATSLPLTYVLLISSSGDLWGEGDGACISAGGGLPD